MQGYELLGLGAMPPILKKLSKSEVLNAIKTKMSGVTTEIRDGLRGAYYTLGKWIAANPKKATGIALLGSAGIVTAGNLMYNAFSTDDEMKKAGLLGQADQEVEASIAKAGTLSEKLQEEVAEVVSKASEGDISKVEGSGMEWWHWGLIVGGGVAAIFLVWYMFRGKKGGKRRRRR